MVKNYCRLPIFLSLCLLSLSSIALCSPNATIVKLYRSQVNEGVRGEVLAMPIYGLHSPKDLVNRLAEYSLHSDSKASNIFAVKVLSVLLTSALDPALAQAYKLRSESTQDPRPFLPGLLREHFAPASRVDDVSSNRFEHTPFENRLYAAVRDYSWDADKRRKLEILLMPLRTAVNQIIDRGQANLALRYLYDARFGLTTDDYFEVSIDQSSTGPIYNRFLDQFRDLQRSRRLQPSSHPSTKK